MSDYTYTLPGDTIERLQQTAADHLFIHGAQTKDWRGQLKIFVKGEGVWVEDAEGKRLLDAMAGLWYKAAGYGRTEIAEAIYHQALAIESPPSGSALPCQIELAGRIASLYHDKNARVFFTSGGSEAVETAVKMAKKWQSLNGKPGAYKVVSRRYSYHGATAMAVSLGRALAADPMGPEMPGALYVTNWDSYRVPFGGSKTDAAVRCADEFEAAIRHADPKTVAAIIAEPVSAAAGIHPPPPAYWHRLREIADKYNVLLIADEVITGFGRTGRYFATDHWNVKPDITTVAKAMTSGYAPLGAAIVTQKVADSFIGGPDETLKHLITFGGHPLACVAALANLDIFQREDLVENAERMEPILREKLEGIKSRHKIVGDVRGIGLLWAIELVADQTTRQPFPESAQLAQRLPHILYENGIVSFRAGDVISLCPPLILSEEEADFIADALDKSIKRLESEL